jgi:hypothetical protein
VFPAGGNNCSQLAQAYFSRFHFATDGEESWSKGTSLRNWGWAEFGPALQKKTAGAILSRMEQATL